jgi:hypothetical protein
MKDITEVRIAAAKKSYETACNEYLRIFCEKHDLDIEPYAWVGDRVGGMATVADFYVNMQDMIDNVESNAKRIEFFAWYEYCTRAGVFGVATPNFRSWHNGCPRRTEEELDRMENMQRKINELTDDLEKIVKQR